MIELLPPGCTGSELLLHAIVPHNPAMHATKTTAIPPFIFRNILSVCGSSAPDREFPGINVILSCADSRPGMKLECLCKIQRRTGTNVKGVLKNPDLNRPLSEKGNEGGSAGARNTRLFARP